jgi:hypothetical protein
MTSGQIKKCGLLLALTIFSSFSYDLRAADQPQEFTDFSGLRTELLSKMGGASKRIWIVTDFLSDAEIVSSLFIAQYRKLDISALLGKDRATHILSRLNYLKQVNIPVSLRPKDFYTKYRSIILIDNQIFGLNAPLDHMSKSGRYSLELLTAEQAPDFESRFSEAAKLNNAPQMAPLPQVGRPRPNSRYYKGSESSASASQTSPKGASSRTSGTSNVHGSTGSPRHSQAASTPSNDDGAKGSSGYRYRSQGNKAPEGIPTKLPRTTLRQQLDQERERQRSSESTKTPAAD